MASLVPRRVCDVCGAFVTEPCERHPWADLLDPSNEDDAAYIAGRKSLVVGRFQNGIQAGSGIALWVGVVAVFPTFLVSPEAAAVVMIGTAAAGVVAAVSGFVGLFTEG